MRHTASAQTVCSSVSAMTTSAGSFWTKPRRLGEREAGHLVVGAAVQSGDVAGRGPRGES